MHISLVFPVEADCRKKNWQKDWLICRTMKLKARKNS